MGSRFPFRPASSVELRRFSRCFDARQVQNRGMQLVARHVKETDRTVFEQLHSAYLAEGELQNRTEPSGWLDTVYSQALSGQRHLWLAKLGNEYVGFCSFRVLPFFRDSSDKFADLQDFYIVASVRGRGLGRQLAGRQGPSRTSSHSQRLLYEAAFSRKRDKCGVSGLRVSTPEHSMDNPFGA